MSRRKISYRATCSVCDLEFEGLMATGSQPRKTCGSQCFSKKSSETMAATNRVHASARMKSSNPMHSEASRARMSATLKSIGHKPTTRGGNGHPPTFPEAIIAQALGWLTGVTVRTNTTRGSGLPSHYKLDVADPESLMCVEIDGGSHCTLVRKAQDQKKETFLRGLGWKVFRVTNKQVLTEYESTISKLRELIRISQTEY